MKFGQILGGFSKGLTDSAGNMGDSTWKELISELEKTREAIEKETKIQQKLESTNAKLLEERQKLEQESSTVAPGSEKGKEIKKKLAQNEKDFKENWSKMQDSVNTTASGQKDIASITEELEGTKGFKGLAEKMGATAAETEILGVSVGEFLGAIAAGPAALVAIAATAVAEVAKMTYEMMEEQNKSLIELERSTGGMSGAAAIGADKFGRLEGGISTVGDATRRANVSMEQFAESLTSFYKDSGGHIMGTADLTKQKSAMEDLGLYGARIKKLYGADIIPAVSELFKNWGQDSISDLTDIMHDGVMQAKAEGLDPEQFAKNMQDVGKLAGKLTFKNGVKGMKDMALYATKMGVSVDQIAEGYTEMNSFTDIFEQQAKLSAMGFHNLSGSMGRVYGQRMSGDSLGAYQTEKENIINDLIQQTGIDQQTGLLSAQGQQMLGKNGLNYTQEQITEIVRATKAMKTFGLSVKDAVKPMDELTPAIRSAMLAQEENNKTLSEQWEQTTGEFKASVTDRLALAFAPLLNLITKWLGHYNAESLAEDKQKKAINKGVSETELKEIQKKSGVIQETRFSAISKDIAKMLAGGTAGTIYGMGSLYGHIKNGGDLIGTAESKTDQAVQLQEYSKNLTKAIDEHITNTANDTDKIDEHTEAVEANRKSIQGQIADEREKRRLFARANIGAILDAATRDLVKYGSVANIKQMSVPDVNTQFNNQQAQQAQNNTTVSPTINTTVKVDPVTGKTDAKTASYTG